MGEINGLAICQDEVDFAMGDANGFNEMFDRYPAIEAVREGEPLFAARQKIIQFSVESKKGLVHSCPVEPTVPLPLNQFV
jgi:hypothetical protein